MGSRRSGPSPELLQRIIEKLEEDFIIGSPPGRKLPSERTLAKQYQASRGTINSALEVLRTRRVLVRKIGKGTFVAEDEEDRWRLFAGKAICMSFSQSVLALNDPFRTAAVQNIMWQLRKTNLNLALVTRDWRLECGLDPALHFCSPDVLGIFLMEKHSPTVFRTLANLNKPMIALDYDATKDGIDSFCFDNFEAGALAARRLHKLGHRRFVLVGESSAKPEGRRDAAWAERREGFVAELIKHGNEPAEEFGMEFRSAEEELEGFFGEVFGRPLSLRPTAVFLPSTIIAGSIKRIAAGAGLQIPRDLSIVGCAHLNEDPDITAIRFNGEKLGGPAAMRMLAGIQKRKFTGKPILVRIKGHYTAGNTHSRAPV